MSRPVKVFFSYSHRDETFRDELEVHLAGLKRQGIIEAWHDRRIDAGKEIDAEIDKHLESADVILLLVSPYFIASDYCYDIEMKKAIERHQSGLARVIPVIVNPCDWHGLPFGTLRATPTDGKPLSKFPNVHDGYVEVVRDLRAAATELGLRSDPEETIPSASHPAPLVEQIRSSNLRIRHEFSDKHRDDFLEESFEYVAKFFANSLSELENRNPDIETRFSRLDQVHFTASIYRYGKKRASCRIWLARRDIPGGGIYYSSSDTGRDNSFNESLSVTDDGYQLLLKPLGVNVRRDASANLSQQGAAEFLWSLLIDPMQ